MSDDLAQPVAVVPPSGLTDALTSAAGYALNEKADATRRAYRSDIRLFYAWCDSVGRETVPAEAATVAAYCAHCADSGSSTSTIKRRLAAIAYAHRLGGFDAPTSAESVKSVFCGIRRRLGTHADAKAPATAKIVAAMVKHMSSDLSGKRDKALILLGFAAALRRSELVALDLDAIHRTDRGMIVHIGKSKTDQEGAGADIAVPRGRKLRAIEALDDWICSAGLREGAIFRAIGKGGRLLPGRLTDASVALIVKKWAKRAKLDPTLFSGHSLRAGFVTSALEGGADILKVMDVTRHREVKTLKVYDRRAKAFKDHAGEGFL